jgi:hypothetical protein
MFLDRAELIDLTERKTNQGQMKWLRANCWPFAVGANGRPKVLRATADAMLLPKAARKRKKTGPNLSVLTGP